MTEPGHYHDLLKELIAWLIKHGSPVLGSREAGEALKSFDFQRRTDALLEGAHARLLHAHVQHWA